MYHICYMTGAAHPALGPHHSLPFGLIPPASSRSPAFPPVSSSAYTNTLSVAASQAASLGIPAASAAWWSMASQLAAQDYIARLQASGLSFPVGAGPGDPYAALGLQALGMHKSKKSNGSSMSSKSSSKGNIFP